MLNSKKKYAIITLTKAMKERKIMDIQRELACGESK